MVITLSEAKDLNSQPTPRKRHLGPRLRTVGGGRPAGSLLYLSVGALASTKFIASHLFDVSATDATTFAAMSLLLLAVALAASYIPARRATRVDPLTALRCE